GGAIEAMLAVVAPRIVADARGTAGDVLGAGAEAAEAHAAAVDVAAVVEAAAVAQAVRRDDRARVVHDAGARRDPVAAELREVARLAGVVQRVRHVDRRLAGDVAVVAVGDEIGDERAHLSRDAGRHRDRVRGGLDGHDAAAVVTHGLDGRMRRRRLLDPRVPRRSFDLAAVDIGAGIRAIRSAAAHALTRRRDHARGRARRGRRRAAAIVADDGVRRRAHVVPRNVWPRARRHARRGGNHRGTIKYCTHDTLLPSWITPCPKYG